MAHTVDTEACDYIHEIDTSSIDGKEITIDEVTEGCVDGKGIYDVFMQAHMDAIQQEFAKQRIRGPEYSQVYLGGMQTAMQNAVAFALGKGKASWEAEVMKLQVIKAQAEVALAAKQLCKVDEEIQLLKLQQAIAAAQAWAEIAKTDVDIDGQMTEMLTKQNFIGPLTDSVAGAIITESVLKTIADTDKVETEITLLKQKIVTESAQTSDNRMGIDGNQTDDIVRGVIGKNKNVLQRQADGFQKEADAKIAKVASDNFLAQFSTMDGDFGDAAPDPSIVAFHPDNLWGYFKNAADNTGVVEHASSDIDVTEDSDGYPEDDITDSEYTSPTKDPK